MTKRSTATAATWTISVHWRPSPVFPVRFSTTFETKSIVVCKTGWTLFWASPPAVKPVFLTSYSNRLSSKKAKKSALDPVSEMVVERSCVGMFGCQLLKASQPVFVEAFLFKSTEFHGRVRSQELF